MLEELDSLPTKVVPKEVTVPAIYHDAPPLPPTPPVLAPPAPPLPLEDKEKCASDRLSPSSHLSVTSESVPAAGEKKTSRRRQSIVQTVIGVFKAPSAPESACSIHFRIWESHHLF